MRCSWMSAFFVILGGFLGKVVMTGRIRSSPQLCAVWKCPAPSDETRNGALRREFPTPLRKADPCTAPRYDIITMPLLDSVLTLEARTETAHAALRAQLASTENVLATLAVDLDPASLRFGFGLVALTDQRVLSLSPNSDAWEAWTLSPDLSMRSFDHGGVATLELLDTSSKLATWRFTLGSHAQSLKFVKAFELRIDALREGRHAEALEPDEETSFSAEAEPVPSTWVLLRLWRFAHPYRKQLAAGFALTLASTAASLVPPYLAIPLMDDVLIPFQNGAQIDPWKVGLHLGGLLAAALAAWGLGWARTYLLALVSERIGADLRTTTYDHLLTLSLDYFGGKRTGDL